MSSLPAAATDSVAIKTHDVPVMRITPPSRWWVLPFGELWEFRELLYFFVWRDIKIRYKQTAIGAAWAVLQPLLMMLVFSLFFGRLAHHPSDGLPYPIFYYSALAALDVFSRRRCRTRRTRSSKISGVITKVYFPRLAAAVGFRAGGPGGFRGFVFDVRGADDLLPHSADRCGAVVSGYFCCWRW